MIEEASKYLSQYGSEINLLITSLAALSTFLAALFAYRSIKQVASLNREQSKTQKRKSTLDFVSDKNLNLGEMSRIAYNAIVQEKPHLNNDDKKLIELLGLDNYDISRSTKRAILDKVKLGIPLSYIHGIPIDLVESINQRLVFTGFSSESHRPIANLFNRLEEVSNAINANLLDLDMFDKMYGGFLFHIYEDYSDWLVYIKRKLGFRFFDQLDVLISLLFEKSIENYNIKKINNLIKLFIQGRAERAFAFFILKNWNKIPTTINRKKLIEYSLKFQLSKSLDKLSRISKVNSVIIEEKINKDLNSRRLKKITNLFADSVLSSNEVWPVGVKNDPGSIKNWIYSIKEDWDISFLAYYKQKLKKELVGFIAISKPKTVVLNLPRWNAETISAANFGLEIPIEEYFNKIFVPYLKVDGELQVNFEKFAMMKSLYVHNQFRKSSNNNSIGRKLLRSAINYCRIELNAIPFLTVIADREYSEKAIKLYIGEGGSFIGTCRDGNKKNGHLMHVFIF